MIHLLDIGIIEVAPLLLAAVRSRVSVAMLSDAIANSPVWDRVRERGIEPGERKVVIYWGESDDEVTVDSASRSPSRSEAMTTCNASRRPAAAP